MMKHCVFEYIYSDAGNFKAWGELLLEGSLSEAEIAGMRERFESGDYFIAEQIGIPTLYETLWKECRCAPSEELDHVWHEFRAVRVASDEDRARLTRWGNAQTLLAKVMAVKTWKLELSRNWDL